MRQAEERKFQSNQKYQKKGKQELLINKQKNQKQELTQAGLRKDGNWLVNYRMAGPRIEQQLEYMDQRTAGNKSF